ncbi:MAG TPA: phosphoserine phosphatase SerB [Pseudidiomarina sp.]|nr:phosphoserine phosphatase SerB [Pseudidiomarina sp.]
MLDFSQPGLAVFDMDSTLITIECIDEIAALVSRKPEIAAITEAAMRGELDFVASLRQRVAALAGIGESQFQRLFDPIPLTPGASALCQWLQEQHWRIVIASGGFTWFAERLQKQLNIDAVCANELEWQQGQLTGRVVEPVVDAERKAEALRDYASRWEIPLTNTLAIGDGANDIQMLEAAACGVAFCAKSRLKAVADIIIDEPDLSTLIQVLMTGKAAHGKD